MSLERSPSPSESSRRVPTISPSPASTEWRRGPSRSACERVQVLAWRDFEDPEAGGSELHAHRMATVWARVGLDISMRTSAAPGQEAITTRDGYQVIRKSGRHAVFPRSALSGLVGRRGRPDGLIEIWNGMPFFTPLWARCPRIVFLHHVHAAMWRMVLTPRLARLGETIELRVAPPLYRHSRVLTPSTSSRDEILSMLGLDASRGERGSPGRGRPLRARRGASPRSRSCWPSVGWCR